jgi:hypothetical protein
VVSSGAAPSRPERSRSSAAIKLKIVEKTVKERPAAAVHWSMRTMQAAAVAYYAVVEPEGERRVRLMALAIARRTGSSSFVVVDCPIVRCLARDRPTRFAGALGQRWHKRLPVAEKAPPTRGPPRTPGV